MTSQEDYTGASTVVCTAVSTVDRMGVSREVRTAACMAHNLAEGMLGRAWEEGVIARLEGSRVTMVFGHGFWEHDLALANQKL